MLNEKAHQLVKFEIRMSCPLIPELKKIDFGQRIQQKAIADRIPLGGTFELTFRCNINCVHCYCNLPANDPTALSGEMSLTEIKRLLDTLAQEGCLWLLFTGGEPLLRSDFTEIYRYAREQGFIVSVFTNGTLISQEIAEVLYEYPPFLVEITLYGATQSTYEKVTQTPGSFSRCMNGIRRLLERGIHINLKTMVMTLNKHEIEEMNMIADRLGVEFRFDPLLNGRLDDTGKELWSLRLSPEEVVRLDLDHSKRVESLREFTQTFWGPPQTDRLYFCGAGLTTFHFDPYGMLYVCMLSRGDGYNLRTGSFTEGWYHFLAQVREKKPEQYSLCRECNLVALCGNCPGWGYLESRNETSMVRYLCDVAHLRAKAIGLG